MQPETMSNDPRAYRVIRFHRNVYTDGDWELSFVWSRFQIRIGSSQFAIWYGKYYKSLIDWRYGSLRKEAT